MILRVESFGHAACSIEALQDPAHARTHEAIDEISSLVRSYLK